MTEAMTIHRPHRAKSEPKIGRNRVEPLSIPHHVDALSFMALRSRAEGDVNYWMVESTGSYSGDCEKGAELAREYLAYIGRHPTIGNAALLGWIVADMADHSAKGLKIGFLRVVNEHAMAAAKLVSVLEIDV